MNTSNMISIDFSRNITPAVAGDVVYNSQSENQFTLNSHDIDCIEASDNNRHLFVVSFADRPNTGKQPVGDNVVVVMTGSKGDWLPFYARCVGWNIAPDRISWKPNHASMLAGYKKTQEPKEQRCGDEHPLKDGDVIKIDYRDLEMNFPCHSVWDVVPSGVSIGKGEKPLNNGLKLKPIQDPDSNLARECISESFSAVVDDKHEMNAATALYAFAGWLTSMKEPVTFSENHWATPAAEMVGSFINLNGLKGEVYFDQVKTPSDSVIPQFTVTDEQSFGTDIEDKPVFEIEMLIGGGKNVDEIYKPGKFVYRGSKYSIFVTEEGREYSRKNSKIKTQPIDIRTDYEKTIDDVACLMQSAPGVAMADSLAKSLSEHLMAHGVTWDRKWVGE